MQFKHSSRFCIACRSGIIRLFINNNALRWKRFYCELLPYDLLHGFCGILLGQVSCFLLLGSPSLGVIKVNFDASFDGVKIACFKLVVRVHLGTVLVAPTSSPLKVLPPMLVDALELRWALSLAIDLCFRSVC